MFGQQILSGSNNYAELDRYLRDSGHKKALLVCGSSIKKLRIGAYLDTLEDRLGIRVIRFSDFQPNPQYGSVVRGVEILNAENCSLIIAVGGGSAVDVAKCIKLFANMDHGRDYLSQEIVPNGIELVAVPTTAGTGSEATHFAVLYYKGEKQSVSDSSCIPAAVILDPSLLNTLPGYYRKATMMDAFCHAIESFWSVNSTQESRQYSREAIRLLLGSRKAYLDNGADGNAGMLKAANIAGRAINIAQTTAGHAMCYKLTGLYGIAHGHAAALCVSKLFPYMAGHAADCADPRGREYLEAVFGQIAEAMGCTGVNNAVKKFDDVLAALDFGIPEAKEKDYAILGDSVNPARLRNNPVRLSGETLDRLYRQILSPKEDFRK